MGQRGLLFVGVLALLATGGFFLNYAFDRGWVPEWLRAAGAVAAGIGVAAWGDRLVLRGMRAYGAALIGAGGGLAYLGVWASAGPYALLGPEPGVVLLALVAAAVAAGAARHTVEALAVWALVGAFLAPAFLPSDGASMERLLGYLAVVGTSSMYLGYRYAWRATLDLGLVGMMTLPLVFAFEHVDSPVSGVYFAFGGVVALVATARAAWPEARVGALVLPWLMLLFITVGARPDEAGRWTALGGGLALAITVWWQQRSAPPVSAEERVVYVLAPLAPVYLAAQSRPEALAPWGGAVALALAALYLGAGWPRRAGHLVGMGVALTALAISGQWEGTVVAVGWAALAAAAILADRVADQRAARTVATGVAMAAFLQLFSGALTDRPAAEAAFTGAWALGWYATLAATAAAAWWWRARTSGGVAEDGASVLWLLVSALVLMGGTLELQRLLRQQVSGADARALAARVATCVYWLISAAGVAQAAPRWKLAPVRIVMLSAALGLPALSFIVLFFTAAAQRPPSDPAFTGVWSVGWYAACVLPMLAARWWPKTPTLPDPLARGDTVLWILGGAAVLVGGSIELQRVFPSALAGNLAISTFWLAYAAVLVWLGFRLDRGLVRSAGLGVAGLAAAKIALYDLAELEALYRIGSFFVLAIVALAVAYAYNRKASNK